MKNNDIIHTDNLLHELNTISEAYTNEKKLIITDKNCKELCLPVIENIIDESFDVFMILPGEENKTLQTVNEIWEYLSKNEYTRNSLIINLGGGMVSDLGGFAASTFKRGVPYVNIPTTVLAQVDASVGGKTGINFNSLKNEIGVFNQAEAVVISDIFLKTLSKKEFLSGFAEMIKHAVIYDEAHLNELFAFYELYKEKGGIAGFNDLTKKSVKIKSHFVKSDPFDKGFRKILNFGHTFGHAFESRFKLHSSTEIKHGEAVAAGMLCELYLSGTKAGLDKNNMNAVAKQIKEIYNPVKISEEDFEPIYDLMIHDKKNTLHAINCVLISSIGHAVYDKKIEKEDIFEALSWLNYL